MDILLVIKTNSTVDLSEDLDWQNRTMMIYLFKFFPKQFLAECPTGINRDLLSRFAREHLVFFFLLRLL